MSPPAAMTSMKACVPDFAMEPKLLINSLFFMPMPGSSLMIFEFVLYGMALIKKVGWASIFSGSVMSPPAAMASMTACVPEFAMEPKLLISSFFVMALKCLTAKRSSQSLVKDLQK